MNLSRYQGFTLPELLLVITILTMLLSLGGPFFNKLIEQSHRKDTLNRLMTGISYARTEAITRNTNITLCPLDSENRCSGDWNKPVTIFLDQSRSRQLSSVDNILRILPAPAEGKLYGRTGIRKHFGFRPTGMARESIGHLLWCPDDRDAKRAFQIRINMGGRPLLARDTDNDDILEDAYGHDITCP